MANIYVSWALGSDAFDGSTWLLAKKTLAGATAIDAAGDTIFFADDHAETTAGSVSCIITGTAANPVKMICGNDAAEPPTAIADTATIATTGSGSTLTLTGFAYLYGLKFTVGNSTTSINYATGAADTGLTFDNCLLKLGSTNSANRLGFGTTSSGIDSNYTLLDTDVDFSGASQRIRLQQCKFLWRGGTYIGTATATGLLEVSSGGGNALIEGVDLSALASTATLIDAASGVGATGKYVIRNCKLPASWSGTLGVPVLPTSRFELYNCDSADTNYRMIISDYYGYMYSETTIVRTGGASDGVTPLAWRLVTNANAAIYGNYLESPEISIWNDTVGSAKTITAEIVHDSQGAGTAGAFLNDEIWLEVQYLGTSGAPLGSFLSDSKADVLATAADQTSSSVTWTTTGLTTPVKQKLNVTFTPQEKGYVQAKVMLAKASKTCYVCPKVTIT